MRGQGSCGVFLQAGILAPPPPLPLGPGWGVPPPFGCLGGLWGLPGGVGTGGNPSSPSLLSYPRRCAWLLFTPPSGLPGARGAEPTVPSDGPWGRCLDGAPSSWPALCPQRSLEDGGDAGYGEVRLSYRYVGSLSPPPSVVPPWAGITWCPPREGSGVGGAGGRAP